MSESPDSADAASEPVRRRSEVELPGPEWDGWTSKAPEPLAAPSPGPGAAAQRPMPPTPWGQQPPTPPTPPYQYPPGQWDQRQGGASPFEPDHSPGQYVDYTAPGRPWWGLGDVLLSIPFIVVLAIFGALIALPLLSGDDRSAMLNSDATPPAVIGMGLIFQQAAQGGWPFIVSTWKGRGPSADWRLRFKPIDIVLGIATAIGVQIVVGILSVIFTAMVDESTLDESGNTSFLNDAENSPWLYVLIFGAVIGAPLVEEIYFRGLVMRAFEKRFTKFGSGKIWAVVLSTIVFVLPHFTGAGLVPTLILFAAIGVVGVVLGTLAMVTDRLGAPIIAHMVFNAAGVLGALYTDSEDAAGLLWTFIP